MKYFFCIFLTIFFFTFEAPINQGIKWNPNVLYGYTKNPQNAFTLNPYYTQFKLIDPQNYLSMNDKNKILQILVNIENRQIIPIFCILESLEYPYNENIQQFSEEFAEVLFSFNKFYEDRIMLFVFSINDRQMRITTGKFTKRIFDDNDCKIFLNMIKPFMRNEDYFNGFYKMLQRISREIEDKKSKVSNSNSNNFKSTKQRNTINRDDNSVNNNNSNDSSSDSIGLYVILFIVIAAIVSCFCGSGKKENDNSHVDESEKINKQKEKELEKEKERERQKQEKSNKFGGASSSW